MGKKAKNRYGIQAGDVFVERTYFEDWRSFDFYQVMRLRGETQVVLKQIHGLYTAFDLHDFVKVPVHDSWTDAEEMVRRVGMREITEPGTKQVKQKIWVNISQLRGLGIPKGYLYDKNQQYIGSESFLYPVEDEICRQFPEIKQFKLSEGSGIFAVDRPFNSFYEDCPVIIRYPNGREEQSNLKDLFDIDKIRSETAK